jgi:hypothetical protein
LRKNFGGKKSAEIFAEEFRRKKIGGNFCGRIFVHKKKSAEFFAEEFLCRKKSAEIFAEEFRRKKNLRNFCGRISAEKKLRKFCG